MFKAIMSKRKYADFRTGQSGGPEGSEPKLRSQHARIDGLLEHGKKAIFQSLKVARGFERQKLGRRQKNAKSAKVEADITRFEAEVTALKVCHAHLCTWHALLNLATRI